MARTAGHLGELQELPFAEDSGDLEMRAGLRDLGHDLVAERGDESTELLETRRKLAIIDAREVNGDDDRFRTFGRCGQGLASVPRKLPIANANIRNRWPAATGIQAQSASATETALVHARWVARAIEPTESVRSPKDPCETPGVPAKPEDNERSHETEEHATKREASVPLATIGHLVFVIAAAVGVFSFVSVAKEGELRRRCSPTCILRPNYAGYEKKAPNFTLKDTRGHETSLDAYRGKVLVLNFWTKTCGPCLEEMPEIADLSRILKPMNDVAVLTVSTDDTAEEAIATLKSVLREEPPFAVLMDPDAKIVHDKFGTSLYPETWIIDKNGVIRARFDGAREWSNATVVEFVEQIRGGGYCPAQARDGKFISGDSTRLCEGLSGG